MSGTNRTIKQIAITKGDVKLLDDLAAHSTFWASVRAKFAEYEALTPKQYELLLGEREKRDWQKGAARVGGVAVRNKYATDGGRARCAHRGKPWCEEAATIVVGAFGYCADHHHEAEDELKDWLKARNAERAQEHASQPGDDDGD